MVHSTKLLLWTYFGMAREGQSVVRSYLFAWLFTFVQISLGLIIITKYYYSSLKHKPEQKTFFYKKNNYVHLEQNTQGRIICS